MLSLCLLVGILCVGGVMAWRAQLRSVNLDNDSADARAYAMAAIEMGRLAISQDDNWRVTHKNDAGNNWFTARAIGRGTCDLNVTNPLGALDNAAADPVVMTGTGYAGNARQVVTVTLLATTTPYTCLNNALTSGSTIAFGSTTVSPSGCSIGSNGNVSASNGVIYPGVTAVGTISGNNFQGVVTPQAAAQTLPDSTKVFDYYKSNGTQIPVGQLPTTSGNPSLTNIVLSPTSNPYGPANPKGIYYIQCGNKPIVITQCRIVGTVVLLSSAGLTIQNQVVWDPAVPDYPCALVQGSVTLNCDNSQLKDDGGKGYNYNPPDAPYPYPGGTSDTTYNSAFSSSISGLLYATGNLTVTKAPTVGMITVAGTSTHNADLTLTYDPTILINPPPGFATYTMVPSPQSYGRVTQ